MINCSGVIKLKEYLKLMRVKHYIKNLLIFLPIFFSGNILKINFLKDIVIGFVVFSMISSIVYILNDLRDIEKDKKHPVKKDRPLASGKISIKNAIIMIIILFFISILLLVINNMLLRLENIILILYLGINIFYSFGAKNIPLIDITILSFGFVLRVLYGGLIISVPISSWLFFTILSISFYMALGKRKNELVKLGNNKTRTVLKYYTEDYLIKNMYMFQTLTIVFYSLWTIFGIEKEIFKYSIILIILFLLKYNMNIEKSGFGEPVEVILTDKILIGIGIIYAILSFSLLYIM